MTPLIDGFGLQLAFLRASYTRFALTVAALAAGVALVCAIDLVNQSVAKAFVDVVDAMAGRAALQVTAGGLFGEEVADAVAAVPGVDLAVPVVSATTFAADGSGDVLTLHGIDIANDAAVRVYETRDVTDKPVKDPLLFLNKPDSILVTRDFARRKHLAEGSTVLLETPAGRRRFTVRGLLDPTGVARVFGGNLIVMDVQAAETWFTEPGLVNRVDIVVRREADLGRVATAVQAKLPPGLRVEMPVQRKEDLHNVMRSFQIVLQAAGLLGLVAAFFIAFNRLATVFEDRIWQLGMMRAVGVRVRAVWWELLKEGLVLGVTGVGLGIPLGIGIGCALLPAIATTTAMSSRLAAPDASLVLTPSSFAIAAALGLLTAFLAALRPAWQCAGVSPAVTLRGTRELALDAPAVSWSGRAGLLAATVVAMIAQSQGGSPAWGLAATGGVMVLAATLANPLLSVLSLPLARALSRHAKAGLFAVVALTRKRRRAALVVATLGVGFGSVVWLWIVAQSFERTVLSATRDVLRGDLTISSMHIGTGFVEAPLDDAILAELAEVPGVAVAAGEAMIDWQYGGGPIVVNAFDAAYVRDGAFGEWPLVGRRLPDVWDGFVRGDTALVSTNFLLHLHAEVGDVLTLDTPGGALPLRIGGVTRSLVSPRGTIIMSREVFKKHWRDPHIVHASIRTGGADLEAVRAGIAARLGERYSLKILSARELGDWFADQVRQAFAGLYVLAGLVLVVVLFGVADTFGAAVVERRRELGMVRAVGVRQRHVRRMVLTEALLLGCVGIVLAAIIGFALGTFWTRAMFPSMLGWVLDLSVPYTQLAIIALLGLLVCVLAALVPATRAARLEPAVALRYE